MYELCTHDSPKLTYEDLLAIVPDLIQKRHEHIKTQQDILLRFKNSNNSEALQKHILRTAKEKSDRQKKVSELVNTKFDFGSASESLLNNVYSPSN